MYLSKLLLIIGSALIGFLGVLHMYLTFRTNRLHPTSDKLLSDMKIVHPRISKELTMWDAWVGFNGSHSSGIIFIAVMNIYLVMNFFEIIQSSHFFFLFNIATVAFYVFMAKKYWFSKPLMGASVTLACYVMAYLLQFLTL